MSDRRPHMLERPVIREKFRTQLRSRLMTEAAVVLTPRRRTAFFAQLWLRPALAAVLIGVLVVGGATNAAASSQPGEPLYGLKRVSEDVQVALTFDDLARMQLLSDLTDRRLDELAKIAGENPSAAPTATAEYADAVERFANAVDKLRDADAADTRDAAQAVADAAREKHIAVLDALKEKLPDSARPSIDRVIERENQREGAAPADQPKQNEDGQGRTTPRPANPTPQRATIRPTPRPATPRPTERN